MSAKNTNKPLHFFAFQLRGTLQALKSISLQYSSFPKPFLIRSICQST